jgi:phenylacetate-CoA ligase
MNETKIPNRLIKHTETSNRAQRLDKWLRTKIGIPLSQYARGLHYGRELECVRGLHQKSKEALAEYQLGKLIRMLKQAYAQVPFYRREWDQAGINPERIKTFEDFRKWPVLTKTKMRAHDGELLAQGANKDKLIKRGTGGTTDSPIVLYYDYPRMRFREAEMHYFREWFRWFNGDKTAFLWGAPQDIPRVHDIRHKVLNRLTLNQMYLFSSFMNQKIMTEYVQRINRFKPDILQGYSNPTYLLAEHILKHDLKVHSPKSIVLIAEPCFPVQRKAIERAFASEVFMVYGCREGGYVGCECERHQGYHINCSGLFLEVLNENGACRPGELGNIVFTDLFNYDMPLIRYQIGDMGSLSAEPCSCGSTLPLLDFFAGRETDVFVTPDGDYVSGVSFVDRIIEDCRGIAQMQFVQDQADELLVKMVKGPDFSPADLEQLDYRLESYFKGKVKIIKQYVADIPREKSGKTRFCISNVPKNQ